MQVEDAEQYMLQGLAIFNSSLQNGLNTIKAGRDTNDMIKDELEEQLVHRHPVLGALYNNLSLLHYKQGQHYKAVEFMQQAVHVRTHILGADHPDTLNSAYRLHVLHQTLQSKG